MNCLYRQHRFIKFRIEFLKQYLAFIKKKNKILLNNMTIFSTLIRKKNQISKIYNIKKKNRMDIIKRSQKICLKNFKYINIKNSIVKKNKRIKKSLKKLKRQNKKKNIYFKLNMHKIKDKLVKKHIYYNKKKFKKIFQINHICL
jgi:hypothetical protein